MLSEIREWRSRGVAMTRGAIVIQKVFRGYIGRIKALRMRRKLVVAIRQRYRLCRIVQRLWRGFL